MKELSELKAGDKVLEYRMDGDLFERCYREIEITKVTKTMIIIKDDEGIVNRYRKYRGNDVELDKYCTYNTVTVID